MTKANVKISNNKMKIKTKNIKIKGNTKYLKKQYNTVLIILNYYIKCQVSVAEHIVMIWYLKTMRDDQKCLFLPDLNNTTDIFVFGSMAYTFNHDKENKTSFKNLLLKLIWYFLSWHRVMRGILFYVFFCFCVLISPWLCTQVDLINYYLLIWTKLIL